MTIVPYLHKWDGTMTDRERFNAQMHWQETDRCFNMEFGYWEDNFTLWPLFRDNHIHNNGEADVFFNFDRFVQTGGNVWLSPGFPGEVIAEDDRTVTVRNGDGLIAITKKGGSSIPHYIGSSVNCPDDWEKVKRERFRRDDPARRVDAEYLKAAFPDDRDFPVAVSCGSMIGKIRDMLTFEGLAFAVYDYPDMVEDMVETACVMVEDYLDQVLPLVRFDCASGWEDICFKNGPIVSVPFFRDVVMPRYKRIRKKLDEFGIDLWYTDCDGDVRPIMPYLLEGGINCLFPFEVNSCAHPAELIGENGEWGRRLRIMGGVDKMQLTSREKIDAYLDTLIPLVKEGGYIPFCDHRCPPNVTPEDYLYYLERKKELFCRPR